MELDNKKNFDKQKTIHFRNDSFPIQNYTLIALFYGDVDISDEEAGAVKCGNGTNVINDTGNITMAKRHILEAFPKHIDFTPEYLIVATWDHVGYYNRKFDKVSKHHNTVYSLYAAVQCGTCTKDYEMEENKIIYTL